MPVINIHNYKTREEAIKMVSDLDLSKVHNLKITCKRGKRSLSQNSALHLFFQWVSDELNNMGLTFNFNGIKGMELEIPYTSTLVKECLWKPIQITLFDIDSTTKLDNIMINKILDVLIFFFAKNGIEIHFPNKFDLMVKELGKNNK